jgi:hypothetical protein
MNGEMAIKAIGLHQFGRPEVLGIATKEEPHARPGDNTHGRARGKRLAHLLARTAKPLPFQTDSRLPASAPVLEDRRY